MSNWPQVNPLTHQSMESMPNQTVVFILGQVFDSLLSQVELHPADPYLKRVGIRHKPALFSWWSLDKKKKMN